MTLPAFHIDAKPAFEILRNNLADSEILALFFPAGRRISHLVDQISLVLAEHFPIGGKQLVSRLLVGH